MNPDIVIGQEKAEIRSEQLHKLSGISINGDLTDDAVKGCGYNYEKKKTDELTIRVPMRSRSHTRKGFPLSNSGSNSIGQTKKRRLIYVGLNPREPSFQEYFGDSLQESREDDIDLCNKVKTSKYTALDFVFRSIYHQMKSVVNIYFLFTAIMQLFPILAQTSPLLSFTPLCLLLIVNAAKDGFEDVRRHMSDSKVNRKFTTVLWGVGNYNLRPLKSKNIFVKISEKTDKIFVNFGAKLYNGVSGLTDYFQKIEKKNETTGRPSTYAELGSRDGSQKFVTDPTRSSSSDNRSDTYKWKTLSTHFSNTYSSTIEVENKMRGSCSRAPNHEVKIFEVLGSSIDDWISGQKYYDKTKYSKYKRCTYSHPQWIIQRFSRIAPGDFILLVSNDEIPADCLILSSSNPDGSCLVETKNLDGETNFKTRKCVPGLENMNTVLACSEFRAVIELDTPNPNLSHCNGVVHTLRGSVKVPRTQITSFGMNNVLLRGCIVKNTSWVVCLTLYTGKDAKIMQNSGKDKHKVPILMKSINVHALTNIVFMAGLCLVCTIGAAAYANVHDLENAIFAGWTVNKRESFYYSALIVFLTCVIIFQNIVPISLAVSIEGCKLVYSFLIYADNKLFNTKTGTRAVAQSWNIADDLGQVEYFFTDKTGTLTLNLMKFKKVSLGGKMYVCSEMDNSPLIIPIDQREKLSDINDTSYIKFTSKLDIWRLYLSSIGASSTFNSPQKSRNDSLNICDDGIFGFNINEGSYLTSSKNSKCGVRRNNSDSVYFEKIMNAKNSEAYAGTRNKYLEPLKLQYPVKDSNIMIDYYTRAVLHRSSEGRKSHACHLRKSFIENYVTPNADWASSINRNNLMFPPNRHSSTSLINVLLDSTETSNLAKLFLLSVMLCHSAIMLESVHGTDVHLTYSASSPDEGALLEAARAHGYVFLKKGSNLIKVSVMGVVKVYNLLETIEFSSDRKRMSVMIDVGNNKILLLCKGADSVIFKLLSQNMSSVEKQNLEKSVNHVLDLSHEGYRVMLFAYRIIMRSEYDEWLRQCQEDGSLSDPQKRISALEKFETNLSLIGAAGIEDKLQEDVPKSIKKLIDTGVKVWMLTGDKVETAITIGISCNLITQNTKLIQITSSDTSDILHQLMNALEVNWFSDGTPRDKTQLQALIMDGETLKYCLNLYITKGLLLELACRCSAVLFCRVSPLQKAQVVDLVKRGLGAVCLSAGDGANDVSMIRTANIGIGIRGKEGSQAVMAADYAVDEFRNIIGLMFIHGRKAYLRVGSLVLNYFYKNLYLLLVVFFYQFSNSFSGSNMISFNFTMAYNPVLTLLPSLALGIFENDVGATTSLQYGKLYRIGMLQTVYNIDTFFIALAEGVYQAVVCYLIGSSVFKNAVFSNSGIVSGSQTLSDFIATTIFFVATLTSLLMLSVWHWAVVLLFAISLLIFVAYCMLDFNSKGELTFTMGTFIVLSPWVLLLSMILIVTISLLPRIIIKSTYDTFRTRLLKSGQRYDRINRLKRRKYRLAEKEIIDGE